MDVHPGRRIVAGAWVGRDAGRWGDDRGRRARFQEPGHGFPWASDEEVGAESERLPERQSARLAAVCRVVADEIAEAFRRDARRAVDLAGESSDALGAKVVEARGAEWPGQRAWQMQRDEPQPEPREQWRPPEAEWRVLLPEEQARVSPQEQESRRAQVSRPEEQEPVQRAEQVKARGQRASRPLADVPGLPGEEQEPPAARGGVLPLWPRLLSRRVRLRRRFRRPLHP